jgi:hypothetical protein
MFATIGNRNYLAIKNQQSVIVVVVVDNNRIQKRDHVSLGVSCYNLNINNNIIFNQRCLICISAVRGTAEMASEKSETTKGISGV